jgi:hypothetical protein
MYDLTKVQTYAKCAVCGDVAWTEVSDQPQAVICKCGHTCVSNDKVVGQYDPSFDFAAFEAHVNGAQ